MVGGITFRQAIDNNKKSILSFLAEHGNQFTATICKDYNGEREMPAVRKALNELRKEGKIQTDDIVRMWQGKRWWLTDTVENKTV
jgi:hypothetical protein